MSKYKRKYNKFNVNSSCRICLTQSTSDMCDLSSNFRDEITILDALEYVMSYKIKIDSRLPDFVCPMCLGLLKIAYDLKQNFSNSQDYLSNLFSGKVAIPSNVANKTPKPNEKHKKETYNKENVGAQVELLVGNEKYNINDILVVEDNEKDTNSHFNAFLKNLGTSVSASFSKQKKPQKCSEPKPDVLLQKITKQMLDHHVINEISTVPLEQYGNTDDNVVNNDNGSNIEVNNDHLNNVDDNITNDDEFLPVNIKVIEDSESPFKMTYQCSNCKRFYLSESRVKKHIAMCRKLFKRNCYICQKMFKSKDTLVHHLLCIHQIRYSTKTKVDFLFTCDICGESFMKRQMFKNHRLKHEGKKFVCEACGKHFYTKHNVEMHMQTHKKRETKVLCPICGKGFHYDSGLYYHMRFHKNDRPYQCQYCDKKFHLSAALKRHIRTHTGQKPYQCDVCDRSFASSGELKKHSFCHTGFRPHQCKYCLKGFTTKFNLKLHMMGHIGTFHCEYCDKFLVSKEILQFHIRHKHRAVNKEKDQKQEEEEERQSNDENNAAEDVEEEIVGVKIDQLDQFDQLWDTL